MLLHSPRPGSVRPGYANAQAPFPLGVLPQFLPLVPLAGPVPNHPYQGVAARCTCCNIVCANPDKHLVCRKAGGFPPPLDRFNAAAGAGRDHALGLIAALNALAAAGGLPAPAPLIGVDWPAGAAAAGAGAAPVVQANGVGPPAAAVVLGAGGPDPVNVFTPPAAAGPLSMEAVRAAWERVSDALVVFRGLPAGEQASSVSHRQDLVEVLASGSSQAFWDREDVREWATAFGLRCVQAGDGTWRVWCADEDGVVRLPNVIRVGMAAATAARNAQHPALAAAAPAVPLAAALAPLEPGAPALVGAGVHPVVFPDDAIIGSTLMLAQGGHGPAALFVLTSSFDDGRIPIPWSSRNKSQAAPELGTGKRRSAAIVSATATNGFVLALRCGLRVEAAADPRFIGTWTHARLSAAIQWPESCGGAIPDEVVTAIVQGRVPSSADIRRGEPVGTLGETASRDAVAAVNALMGLFVLAHDPLRLAMDDVELSVNTEISRAYQAIRLSGRFPKVTALDVVNQWWFAYDDAVIDANTEMRRYANEQSVVRTILFNHVDDDESRELAWRRFQQVGKHLPDFNIAAAIKVTLSQWRKNPVLPATEALAAVPDGKSRKVTAAAVGGAGGGTAPGEAGASKEAPDVKPEPLFCVHWRKHGTCRFNAACKWASSHTLADKGSAKRPRERDDDGEHPSKAGKNASASHYSNAALAASLDDSEAPEGTGANAVSFESLEPRVRSALRAAHTAAQRARVEATAAAAMARPVPVSSWARQWASAPTLQPHVLASHLEAQDHGVTAARAPGGPGSAAVSSGASTHADSECCSTRDVMWAPMVVSPRPRECWGCGASLESLWRDSSAVVRVHCEVCGARSWVSLLVDGPSASTTPAWGDFTVHHPLAASERRSGGAYTVPVDVVVVSWRGLLPLWQVPFGVAQALRIAAVVELGVASEREVADVIAAWCVGNASDSESDAASADKDQVLGSKASLDVPGRSAGVGQQRGGTTVPAASDRLRSAVPADGVRWASSSQDDAEQSAGVPRRGQEANAPRPREHLRSAVAVQRDHPDGGAHEHHGAEQPAEAARGESGMPSTALLHIDSHLRSAVASVQVPSAASVVGHGGPPRGRPPSGALWLARYGSTAATAYAKAWLRHAEHGGWHAAAEGACPHPVDAADAVLRVTDNGSWQRAIAEQAERNAKLFALRQDRVPAAPVADDGTELGDGRRHVGSSTVMGRHQLLRLLNAVAGDPTLQSLATLPDGSTLSPWPRSMVRPVPAWACPVSPAELSWYEAVREAGGRAGSSLDTVHVHPAVPVWFSAEQPVEEPWRRYEAALSVFGTHPHGAYIAQLLAVGVPIMDTAAASHSGVHCRNQLFSDEAHAAVRRWLIDEQAADHVIAMSAARAARLPALVLSPLLAVDKRDGGVSKFRVCSNLSFGATTDGDGEDTGQRSVNASTEFSALAPCDLASVAWVVAAATHLRSESPSASPVTAARLDLLSYFRQLRASARDHFRVAHVFDQKVWCHRRFVFGGSASPLVACLLSNAIADVVSAQEPAVRCSVFVDDFPVVGTAGEVERAIASFRHVLAVLDIAENVGKYVPPTSRPTLLGVDFDLVAGSAAVSERRRSRLLALIADVVAAGLGAEHGHQRDSHVHRLLATLGGTFCFLQPLFALSPVITCHIWTATAHLQNGEAHRVQWHATRWALECWRHLLSASTSGSGTSLVAVPVPRPSLAAGTFAELHTDSSNIAFGGVEWPSGMVVSGAWSHDEVYGPARSRLSSNVREAWGCVFAFMTFAPVWAARGVRVVVLRSDSSTACCAFAASRCNDENLYRCVLWLARAQWRWGIRVLPLHLSGSANRWPDTYSRQAAGEVTTAPFHRRVGLPSDIRALPQDSSPLWRSLPSEHLVLNAPALTAPSGDGGVSSDARPLAQAMASMPAAIWTVTSSGTRSSSSC
jgi:hypothetical protein